MPEPLFTVIVPTHDHVESLWFSLESVLAQTVRDVEVVVVGDGAPERTAEIVRAFAGRDPRVRYDSCAKGERHGEAERHRVLASARGRFVAYLADDDLWFPGHLATLAPLLDDHDLAHTMQIDYTPGGDAFTWIFDADADPAALDAMRRNETGFGLASGAHTLDAYRRLPFGWRPAPRGINTDTYFWLQLLDQPWCRYASHPWPSVVHLARIPAEWSTMRRAAELGEVAARIADPAWREQLVQRALTRVHRRSVRAAALAASTALAAAPPGYPLGERVRFGMRGTSHRYAVSGTHEREPWGVWADGTMRIVLPRDGAASGDDTGRLSLAVELVHLLAEPGRPSSVARITVNGEPVAAIEERRPGPHEHRIELPSALSAASRAFTIEIEGDDPASPAALRAGADRRMLSVGLVSLAIERDQRSASDGSHSGANAP